MKTFTRLSRVAAMGLALIGISSFWACQSITSPQMPTWDIDLLGPIAKAELDINSFNDFNSFSASEQKKVSDFGLDFQEGTYSSTPAHIIDPFTETISIDDFEQLDVESGEITFSITNNTPFTFSSGMSILLSSNGGDLLTHVISEPILSNQKYSLPVPADLAGKSIFSELTFSVSQVASEPINSEFTVTADDQILFDLSINQIVIEKLVIASNDGFSSEDTTDFNLGSEEIQTQIQSGEFTLKCVNQMPMDVDLQIYFTDDNGVALDSLFAQPRPIAAATINASGVAISSTESILPSGEIYNERYNRLLQATKMQTVASITSIASASGTVEVNKDDLIEIQIIGQLLIDITK